MNAVNNGGYSRRAILVKAASKKSTLIRFASTIEITGVFCGILDIDVQVQTCGDRVPTCRRAPEAASWPVIG